MKKEIFQNRKYKPCYFLIAATLLFGCNTKSSTETTDLSSDNVIESPVAVTSEDQTFDSNTQGEFSDSTDTTPETDTEESIDALSSSEIASSESTALPAASEEIPDTESEQSSSEEDIDETSIVFYNCDDVMYVIEDARIRLAPSLDSEVYDVYVKGTAVQCIAKSEEWYIVSIGTGAYYIHASLLSPNAPLSSETDANAEVSSETPSASASFSGEVISTDTSNGILYTVGDGPLVCIDAGHQAHGNSDTEPNGPGSDIMKAKVSTGTVGATSGLTEAQLNLTVSCQLRDELISRGYNVLMIRESQDVDISNAQRAQMATAAGANIFVRIHANGSDDTSVSGVVTMSPTAANPYVAALYPESHNLSACIVDAICAQTGAINRGVYETDTMSGINWTTMPVTIVEMGYMTNPTEDLLMASADYQSKIVTGIANGIDTYFGR